MPSMFSGWQIWAGLAALFAAVTALLAKVGVEGVPSNLATGVSWLCYFRALQLGPVSAVAPIDKMSVVLVALLGVFWLGEHLGPLQWCGVALMGAGALLVALP
ncbi:MAG: EamA family transporter [Cyanobacteria bacterium]|nr:EamA family transporter [Cyanobacteriota bacterium]